MNPALIASLIALSIIGLIDSIYLSWHTLRNQPLICPINKKDCNIVVKSSYGKMFGIKNEILGIFYYTAVTILAFIFFFYNDIWVNYILFISSSLAFIASGYLIYVQKYIIKNYCFYCLISAIVNLLIFLNVIAIV